MTWAQLMALGRAQADSELDSRLGSIANLCYTSGTTGNPKVIILPSLLSNTVKLRVIYLPLSTLVRFINLREDPD